MNGVPPMADDDKASDNEREPHLQPRPRAFQVEPLPPYERGSVFSEAHRELVARGEDPMPIRYVDNTPDDEDITYAITIELPDVQLKPVEWLWPGWLAYGKLAVLDGDPSLGKSTLALTLAARVTTGLAFPDEHPGLRRDPHNVVILSAEDGPGDTIKPRLIEANADINRVTLFQGIYANGRPRFPHLPDDIEALEGVVRSHRARFVIVDVLSAYTGGRGMNSHADADMRTVLAPLTMMADRTNASVFALRHLNKSGGTNALYRGGGSIAIIGAARHAYVVGVHPNDETRRVMACTKNNLAPKPTPIAYEVVGGDTYDTARIRWHGSADDVTLEQLMTAHTNNDAPEVLKPIDEAKSWLVAMLNGGPMLAADIKTMAEVEDIAWRTLRRAAKELGVANYKDGPRWWWRLA